MRPNLVIFVADEWRGDALGHAGNPAAVTPHVDRLVATEAVSFTAAYCQSPVCVPSRTSFLTGWYPHVRGHRTQHHLLHADEPHLLQELRDAGYTVWWGGKNDVLADDAVAKSVDVVNPRQPSPTALGGADRVAARWGSPDDAGYYSFFVGRLPADAAEDDDAAQVQAAVRWIAERDPADPPFCVLLTLFTPHCPYGVCEPWFSAIDPDRVPAPTPRPRPGDHKPRSVQALIERQGLARWTPDQWRELRATYYGMIARTDALFAQVLDGLRTAGVYDDTAVFLFSDHGDYAGDFGLPEKAQNLFDDALVRVPLVVKPPADTPAVPGARDRLTELVDVSATIYDLAGIVPGYDSFGRSLLPAIAGDRAEERTGVFAEGGRRAGETQAMELSGLHHAAADGGGATDDARAGLYFPRMSLQAHDGVAHGKAAMWRTRTHKYVRRLYESDELYDLVADPREQRNVIHDPEQAEIAGQLRSELLDVMIATADVVPHSIDPR